MFNVMKSTSHYNKSLKPFARELRNNSTLGEVILWRDALSRRKMMGYQFLRQYPIDTYIADFICRKVKLIIEIDGYSHIDKFDKDAIRDKRLQDMGFYTLRFKEQQIYNDLRNVVSAIESKISELTNQSPDPLSKGGQHEPKDKSSFN
jgi:very-short-patch-repair endonuclease